MQIRPKTTIGRTSIASFPFDGSDNVPVKIDTGADTSSIWASDIRMEDDNSLSFTLFAPESPHYSGKRHRAKAYDVRYVRSSNGQGEVRYSVKLTIILAGRRIKGSFTLANRSKNTYPILIGCRLLSGKFIVDVSKGKTKADDQKLRSLKLEKELRQDPKAFFKKHQQ